MLYFDVSIVDFEQVDAGWDDFAKVMSFLIVKFEHAIAW